MPRCDHIAFRVADLDASVAFYERLLPARVVSRQQHADRWKTEIATLEPEGQPGFRLVLLHPRRVRWLLWCFHHLVPRQVRSYEHMGFACESPDDLREREVEARTMGVPVGTPVTQQAAKEVWLFEVLDPDRNAVEWTCGPLHE